MNTTNIVYLNPNQIKVNTNTRSVLNKESIAELAASITAHGQQQAVLVRPSGKDYELIFGRRRLEACKLLSTKDKPFQIKAEVQDVQDDDIEEIQMIENLQREDIHPLDEAKGYQKLLDTKQFDIPSVAAKVGKSESYIKQRLQLQHLSDGWKQHFRNEVITLGHALLLARLTESDQFKAGNDYQIIKKHWKTNKLVTCSLVELKQWIEDNCFKKLSDAGWNLNDAELVKEAGSCKECPKRTGFNKTLFNDVKSDDICTDGKCFKKKQTRFFNQNMKELTESGEKFVKITLDSYGTGTAIGSGDYRKAKPNSKNAIKGIISQGKNKGKVINIIPNAGVVQRQEKENKERSRTYQKPEDTAETRAKEEHKRKMLEKNLERINSIRLEVFKEIVKKQKAFSTADWHNVADRVIMNEYNGAVFNVFKFAGIKNLPLSSGDEALLKYLCSLKLPDLQKYLILILIGNDVDLSSWDMNNHKSKDDLLFIKAKELKIDVNAIEKKFEPPSAVAPDKPKSKKKSKSKGK